MDFISFVKLLWSKKLQKKSKWGKFRTPDKIDAIFVIVVMFCVGMIFGMGRIYKTYPEIKAQEYQRAYTEVTKEYQNQIDYYVYTLSSYEGFISQSSLSEEKYFHYMTKSALREEKRRVEEFLESFEKFEMEDYPLYKDLQRYESQIENTLKSGHYLYPYTDWDYEMLAYAIYREAGSSLCPQEEREDVGCVILNRQMQGGINRNMIDPSIADIIDENKWNGGPIQYPYYSSEYNQNVITKDCYEAARRVLEREVVAPRNVLYQAQFRQGSGVYHVYDHSTGEKTYICYE